MAEEYKPEIVDERKAEFERLKGELLSSLREGLVHDPVTAAVAGIFTLKTLFAVGVSVGVSLAVGGLTRALTPRQKLERGRMTGEIFMQKAGQGEFWDEVYGADPETNATVFATSTALSLHTRVIPSAGHGRYYRVTVAGTTGGSAPAWPSTKGATVTSGSVTFVDMGETGGGVRKGPLLLWMPPDRPIRLHRTTTRGTSGGGKGGPKQPDVTEISYDTDLGHGWGRGSLLLKKLWAASDVILDRTPAATVSHLFDPGVVVDPAYDHKMPPDAGIDYPYSLDRFDGPITIDGTGVGTGTINGGGNANIAIYPGNTTQLQDPTIEAATDAKHGAGSTPAYRGRCYSLLKNFYLTRYQGAIPPFTGLVEHQTILTLKQFAEHQCSRVGLLSSDYDASGVTTIDLRGLLINNRYTPKGALEALFPLFNAYAVETDKIYFKLKGQAPVDTVEDWEIGWLEEDSEVQDVSPELDYEIPVETDIARRIEIRSINPARDFEPDMHGSARQITNSERIEAIEVQVTLTAEEDREITDRLLYEEEVESVPIRGTVSWEKLWWNAGDSIVVNRAEGFTETLQITSIKKCIGVLECEFVRVESAVFTQPAVAQGGVFEPPPVPIPQMTIVTFFDTPLLRDAEASVNNGSGIYAGGAKRTGGGSWNGAELYVDRGLDYERLGTFTKPATMGHTASVLTGTTKTTETVADALTVDLYGTEAALESTTAEGLSLGANACIVGDEVCQILTATNISDVDHPNRWSLVIGRRGLRGTEAYTSGHLSGERFALIDDALVFIPLNINELNIERTYKAVTSGQSVADAAEVDFAWTGASMKTLAPSNATRRDDSGENSLLEWTGRGRLGHGARPGLVAFEGWERAEYSVDIWDAGRTEVLRTMPVNVAASQAALLVASGGNKFVGIDVNTATVSGGAASVTARTIQEIHSSGNFIEATLSLTGSASAGFGLLGADKDWQTATYATADFYARLFISGVTLFLKYYVGGVEVYSETDPTDGVFRIRITLSGSEVRFTKNWTGPGTPPGATSAVSPVYPLIGTLSLGGVGTTKVERVVLTTWPDPKTIYTAAQKAEDGLTPGDPIEADIYQVTPNVGRGHPLRVTLANSLQ